MPDRRVRILCTEMGAAMAEVSRLGLKALDPRWCYTLLPGELRRVEEGAHVVDLTHLPRPTTASLMLRDYANQRKLRLVSVHHLARLPPYVAGTG